MLFSSVKEINRLISKGMSNIYLEVAIEKNFWKLWFSKYLSIKICFKVNFWAAPTYADINEF